MKIILDSQAFDMQQYGGISRYYTEIFSVLSQRKDVEIAIPLVYTRNVYFNESVLTKNKKSINVLGLYLLEKVGVSIRKKIKKRNWAQIKKKLSKQDFDIFVPTYYDSYFLKDLNHKPFVLTVYDMIHELLPQYFSDAPEVAEKKLFLIEKATRIIAVSENTKKDILKFYPHLEESKIDVVYHGSSIKINNDAVIDLPENYILYVGSRANYKNFDFLVQAIKEILKDNPELYLVCAGGKEFSKNEIEFVKSLNLEKQIIQKDFDEKALGSFYKNAKCFVFPSLYEGFGIPVLESMACGCPVVLGNHSSFPEVAGEAGIYFDINDNRDLTAKINNIIQNPAVRDDYAAKGLQRVRQFNWEQAAEECLNVYKKALI
ncbi:glycosyltransferase family 4 protein [Flavobacterium foetidum]|uniref:glycosyltransferase family 4 protein n=1 Tax=Flavobacterium foetidum TaxID=2026681 RepID=UPI001075178D|nr:glycosyltransferase family 1 protein [Flavobacterium foetidum]KAF2517789.1 glycosyltransferase family 4 protein [Flavobacterium foetidum]